MVKRKRDGSEAWEDVKYKKSRAAQVEDNTENASNKEAKKNGTNGLVAERNVSILQSDKASAKMARRAAKIERRKLKRLQRESAAVRKPSNGEKKVGADQTKERRSRKKSFKHRSNAKSSGWSVSDAIGGQMLDLEPIFALNEEYLLVAYDSSVNVYSASTSLLVRKLCIDKPDRISSFVLSPSTADQVFISTVSGSIEKWDWTKGIKLEYWYTSVPIYRIIISSNGDRENWNGLIYTIDKKNKGQWMLTVHRLLGGKESSKTDLGTLFRCYDPLTSVKIIENGKTIILTSGSKIIFGSCDQPDPGLLKDISYVWRNIDSMRWITSIDVRTRPFETPTENSKKGHLIEQSAIDVVVGNSDGCIVIYDNLMESLINEERKIKSGTGDGVRSRRLHWHRNPVLALKWSVDGNYLISGGAEAVLVIWQLDTTHKQFLPHLSASIENIVVSPVGSSYCVRLADNSVMILSTSELRPTFNVAGIQIPAIKEQALYLPYVPSVDAPSHSFLPKQSLRFPVAVSPSVPGRLLLAVPSTINSRLPPKIRNSTCYLQTFDLSSMQQLSRQALTPTNATIFKEGPENNTLEEPNVLHMQISYDGRWLATVDEWLPPKRDVTLLAFDREKEVEEQLHRREIYLRIWLWNEITSTWELTFKIHNPHASSISILDRNLILDLKSDPTCAGFATLGNDHSVRIWKPSARYRHGTEVRDKNGMPLTNWNCKHIAHLGASSSTNEKNRDGAKLAYSPDGSVLATGYGLMSPSTIFLVDPSDGTVQRTLVGLYTGHLFGLGILDRYLIILSQELRVWDLVTEEFSFGFVLQHYGLSMEKMVTATHLAIDARHGTFAISLPEIGKNSKNETKVKSQTIIFNPENPTPLFSVSTPNITTALLPTHRQKGYYVIDSAAEIRTVSPKPSVAVPPPQSIDKNEASFRSLDNLFGDDKNPLPRAEVIEKDTDNKDSRDEFESIWQLSEMARRNEENGVAVVTRDQLAEIFDTGSALTLPPVTELFKQTWPSLTVSTKNSRAFW